MTTKHKPATPLPWHLGVKQAEQIVYDDKGWPIANATVFHGMADEKDGMKQNAHYIAHAANAYPRLVNFVREIAEMNPHPNSDRGNVARSLLRELGEG